MGQSMVASPKRIARVAIVHPHCPFEALLPLATNPPERKHKKRPVVVVASQCVGCLSCIGSAQQKRFMILSCHPFLPITLAFERQRTRNRDGPSLGQKGLGWA